MGLIKLSKTSGSSPTNFPAIGSFCSTSQLTWFHPMTSTTFSLPQSVVSKKCSPSICCHFMAHRDPFTNPNQVAFHLYHVSRPLISLLTWSTAKVSVKICLFWLGTSCGQWAYHQGILHREVSSWNLNYTRRAWEWVKSTKTEPVSLEMWKSAVKLRWIYSQVVNTSDSTLHSVIIISSVKTMWWRNQSPNARVWPPFYWLIVFIFNRGYTLLGVATRQYMLVVVHLIVLFLSLAVLTRGII